MNKQRVYIRLVMALALLTSVLFTSHLAAQTSTTTTGAKPSKPLLTLEVVDSFVDVRTGPGRGYPIFYVIEQGEVIEVLVRRAGWYEIRSENGRTGWATSAQLSRTLQDSGEPADLPSVSFGDYQKNKWRAGFTFGQFVDGELLGESVSSSDVFSGTISYRFLSWFALEGEAGRFFSSQFDADFYNINLLFEPFSHWRFSPEVFIGRGKISLETQPELTTLVISDEDFDNYGIALNYYLGRNFVIRTEYRRYSVSIIDDTENLDSWKFGFNTFF